MSQLSLDEIRGIFEPGQQVRVNDHRGGYYYDGQVVRYERNGDYKILDPSDGTYCDHHYDTLTAIMEPAT
jgi:hypothetical protein